jgi:cbb3-type cytochrome oxidase maturation protein
MNSILYLIPIALGLGLVALGAFAWSVASGQYRDLKGDSVRMLEDDDTPLDPETAKQRRKLIETGEHP